MDYEDIKSIIIMCTDAREVAKDSSLNVWCEEGECSDCTVSFICRKDDYNGITQRGVDSARSHVRSRLSDPKFRSDLARVFMHMMGIDCGEDAKMHYVCDGGNKACLSCLSAYSTTECAIGTLLRAAMETLPRKPPLPKVIDRYSIISKSNGEEICRVTPDCLEDLELYRNRPQFFNVMEVCK